MEKETYITKIGLHAAKNILGSQEQISLFSEHDVSQFIRTDTDLSKIINRFGIDLTDMEFKLVEGILRGFSEINYNGALRHKTENENVDMLSIPMLKITQKDLLQLSGIEEGFGPKTKALEALQSVGEKQYCFLYHRLVCDENNQPLKDAKGRFVKEEITSVSSLFVIKEVKNTETHNLMYYEVFPANIFLDQLDSFFMMLPIGWRDEVRAIIGERKISAYLYRFLFFLRYQYEVKRRFRTDKPFTIKWAPREICVALKMPESIYHRKKKRSDEILSDCYEVAKQLGYLKSVSREATVDCLVLNDFKFYSPARLIHEKESNPESLELYEFFHAERRKLDPVHKTPTGCAKIGQLKEFDKLLKDRSKEDVAKVIAWAFTQKFWCSQLSTPHKLREKFSAAFSELSLSKQLAGEDNQAYCRGLISKVKLPKGIQIDILNKAVEVGNGMHQPNVIGYAEKDFKAKLEAAFRRWGISSN